MMRLFTTEDGLVRNWVTRIRRDSHDRLWFCTVEGLSLFDGRRFINYTLDDGLPNRAVNDILEAGDGNYWLATGAGLYRFRPRSSAPAVFNQVPLAGIANAGAADVLFKSRNGEIWVGTERAMLRVEGKSDARAIAAAVPDQLRRTNGYLYIHAFTEGPDGSLWVGADEGVMRRTPNGRLSYWKTVKSESSTVKALLLDHDGVLWAGGNGGFATLDTRLNPVKIERHPMNAEQALSGIESIYEDNRGTIWMGAQGLVSIERRRNAPTCCSFHFYPHDSPLGSQYVFSMSEDASGNLWVALSNLGVARIMKEGMTQFTEADGLESNHVDALLEDQNGDLFAVTGSRHTLNSFNGNGFVPIRERVPANVSYFGWGEINIALESRQGEWWIASGQGLLRYPRVAHAAELERVPPKAIYERSNGLKDAEITRLFEDSRGDIWIGTASGLSIWHSSTDHIEDLTLQLGRMFDQVCPLSFAEDRSGAIWIGLFPVGLVRVRGGNMERVSREFLHSSISSLLTDRSGRLWVASSSQGLGLIEDPSAEQPVVRMSSVTSALKSKHLFDLAEDQDGRIYVAGGRGVDRLNPSNGALYHFSATGELPPGETQRLYCDRHGAIWFASNFGLTRYVPQPELTMSPVTPLIHEVRASGATALISDEGENRVPQLRLPYYRDSIEITFGSVDFSVGDNIHYLYRLVGLQGGWQQANSSDPVRYAGIGSGNYRFEVKAINSSGTESPDIASVDFIIAAPFWRTWWFLLLAGLVAVTVAVSAHRSRVSYLVGIERVRANIAADLHDNLGSGLAEIAILAEVARRRGEAQRLEGIARRARDLRASMSDIIWSVDPSCDDLEHLVRRWREAAFSMLPNAALEFVAPEAQEASKFKLSSDQRRHLLLFFKESVTNIARHANANRVWIVVRLVANRLEVEIRDDGCGWITGEPKSGNGLRNMSRRAQALGGAVRLWSIPGSGARVSLSVPLQ